MAPASPYILNDNTDQDAPDTIVRDVCITIGGPAGPVLVLHCLYDYPLDILSTNVITREWLNCTYVVDVLGTPDNDLVALYVSLSGIFGAAALSIADSDLNMVYRTVNSVMTRTAASHIIFELPRTNSVAYASVPGVFNPCLHDANYTPGNGQIISRQRHAGIEFDIVSPSEHVYPACIILPRQSLRDLITNAPDY